MRREHTFRVRLGDAEHEDLAARAAAEGIAKADVIRKALGWEPEGLIRRKADPSSPASRATNPTTGSTAGDEDGPGARGLTELARRIAERQQRTGTT